MEGSKILQRTAGRKVDYFKIYSTLIVTCGAAKSRNLPSSGRSIHFSVYEPSKLSICSLPDSQESDLNTLSCQSGGSQSHSLL